jgi:acyl-ACP thioesterase
MPEDLVARPAAGRIFTAERRVRLGDVSPGGRLRLDAVARYLQDVSSDDTADAGLADGDAWVVRRMVVSVRKHPVFREWLELTTWCSGTGSHFAERRVSIAGDAGGSIEAGTLWVSVDLESGRPRRLTAEFDRLFGAAADSRRVKARLSLPPPPDGASGVGWPLRFTDYDVLDHVNNAAYFSPVEEQLARRRDLRAPFIAVMEYGPGVQPGAAAEVVVDADSDALALWIVAEGSVAAACRVYRA